MIAAQKWLPGVALISLAAAALVVSLTQHSRERIAVLREDATRLAEEEAKLTKTLMDAQTGDVTVAGLQPENIWRAGPGGSVEVQIQQALVETAKSTGLTPASFGVGVPIEGFHLATLSEDLELSGSHEALARFLADVERLQPALAISYLWLRQLPVDPSTGGSPVSVRITVWGFVETSASSP
jgi:hypothetical protein